MCLDYTTLLGDEEFFFVGVKAEHKKGVMGGSGVV